MKVENLIIGAGPAGLAVAGRFRKRGIPFEMLEASDRVGFAWHNHYERLHLHTVKQWSHLPHQKFPESYPLYVSRQQLVDYMENYADTFDIRPHFHENVRQINKLERSWQVNTTSGNVYEAKNVIIATGINRIPNRPKWKGEENFQGTIIHSRDYKNAQTFTGKRVLVVGMGNTGAELALDLSENGTKTYLSARSAISIVPRDLNGRPVQVTGKQLAKLPWGLGDWIGTQIRKIYFGDLSKYGLQTHNIPPAKQLAETGKTPVIDIGTVAAIKAGKIKVVGDIETFHESGVHLKNGESLDVDAVVLATGYRAKIEAFLERGEEVLDEQGCPQSVIGEGFHQGIYFVGFDNYKLGGILGTIYDDSETVANQLSSD